MVTRVHPACVLIAALALNAHAEQNQNAPEPVLKKTIVRTSEEPALGLTQTSSTGSRLELTVLQTPASVDIINSQVIRSRGQTSVTQAVVQNGVGISIGTAPLFGSAYVARGFVGNNSIMQLYDGTRLYLGIGNISFPFDTWTVERIEVLHGPASVLYGEGAIGGVVNVVSKRPLTDAVHNEVQVSAGTYDTYGLALDSTGPLADGWSYRISGSGRKSQGWVDLGENSSKTFASSLRWQPTEELSVTFASDYGDQRPMAYFGTPLVDGHLDKSLRRQNYNVDDHRVQFKDSWNQLNTEWTPNDQFELRNSVYLVHSRREWRNVEVYDWNGAGFDRYDYLHIIQSQNQLGDRLDMTLKSRLFGGDNTLVFGFDVNRSDFAYLNNFNDPRSGDMTQVPPRDFDHGDFIGGEATKAYSSRVEQRSLFVEDRYAFTEQWSAVAGARYDHINVARDDLNNAANDLQRNFDTVSWRAGVVYNPIPTVSVYGQYSFATDPVATLLTLTPSNDQFDLAEGRQWEIGVKQSFWDTRGEWTVSYFDIVKKKMLMRNPSMPSITEQIGQQSSHGIELALSLALGGGFSIDANATWLRARYDDFNELGADFSSWPPVLFTISHDGDTPAQVPERSGNLWLGWNFLPGWDAHLGLQYVGKAYQDLSNTERRGGYTVAHATLEWQTTDKLTLALQAHNLFNRVYAELWHGDQQWFLGQPRTVEAVARLKF